MRLVVLCRRSHYDQGSIAAIRHAPPCLVQVPPERVASTEPMLFENGQLFYFYTQSLPAGSGIRALNTKPNTDEGSTKKSQPRKANKTAVQHPKVLPAPIMPASCISGHACIPSAAYSVCTNIVLPPWKCMHITWCLQPCMMIGCLQKQSRRVPVEPPEEVSRCGLLVGSGVAACTQSG